MKGATRLATALTWLLVSLAPHWPALAGGAAATGAPETRVAPDPLADRRWGMGPVEREVYQRVYKGKTG
ncbi:MAG: hypothetical protein JXR37_21360, partial [Kiritimatiellae bacterium]|nr:hypothetical protein [Kiritimatiellia bacterium]